MLYHYGPEARRKTLVGHAWVGWLPSDATDKVFYRYWPTHLSARRPPTHTRPPGRSSDSSRPDASGHQRASIWVGAATKLPEG